MNTTPRTEIDKLPRRRKLRDGHGNMNEFIITDVTIDGKQYVKKFVIKKYGLHKAISLAKKFRKDLLVKHKLVIGR